MIENVPGAPLISPIELCGCMFDLSTTVRGTQFALYRRRLFEINWPARQPRHEPHSRPSLPVLGRGVPGWFHRNHGFGVAEWQKRGLMQCRWMTNAHELSGVHPACLYCVHRPVIDRVPGPRSARSGLVSGFLSPGNHSPDIVADGLGRFHKLGGDLRLQEFPQCSPVTICEHQGCPDDVPAIG